MRVRNLKGHITDSRNKRLEETSRRQRRGEASSEGLQGPEWALTLSMAWNGMES
jgi:hypothetical protein